MAREEETSRWWWFDSHQSSKDSPWLRSTLAEHDAKTKAMLKLIEGDADSFAQRAETYYEQRPKLISMVEDFYRAHRSLAERYNHVKSENVSRSTKLLQKAFKFVGDSHSHTSSESEEEYPESEIDDPENEFTASPSKESEQIDLSEKTGGDETAKLLRETEALRKELKEKDEEKREVIRQLALTIETLKDENSRLRKRLARQESLKKNNVLEFKQFEGFIEKMFHVNCDGKKVM